MTQTARRTTLLLLTLLSVIGANAYDFVLNGICFNKVPGESLQVSVAGLQYATSQTTLTIPSTIKASNKVYRVTQLADEALKNCSKLISVTLTLGIQKIGDRAFDGCSSLTSINIPSSINSIGRNIFAHCENLTTITVTSGNTTYDSRDNANAIIETATNTLIAGCKGTNMVPYGVEKIAQGAFCNSSLYLISITSDVTEIEDSAFCHCPDLQTLNFFGLPTRIGKSALAQCGLEEVKLPRSLNRLEEGVLEGCEKLKAVELGSGITTVGPRALAGCTTLETVTCAATTPPSLDPTAFANTPTYELLVPYHQIEAYKQSSWNQFRYIKSIETPRKLTYTVNGEVYYQDTLVKGDEIPVPWAPEVDGYEFKGWDGLEEDMLMPDQDVAIRAIYERPLGDANDDGWVDVADFSSIVNHILGRHAEKFLEKAADVNQDEYIDVADITTLALLIMEIGERSAAKGYSMDDGEQDIMSKTSKGSKVAEKEQADPDNTLYAATLQGDAGTDVTLSINMRNEMEVTGYQFDLTLPKGVTVATTSKGYALTDLSLERTSSKKTNFFETVTLNDGTLRVLCNSTKGYAFEGHDGEVATITLHIDSQTEDGIYPIALHHIVLTDASGNHRAATTLSESNLWVNSNATSLNPSALSKEEEATCTYDLNGRLMKHSTRGLKVMKGKKVMTQ